MRIEKTNSIIVSLIYILLLSLFIDSSAEAKTTLFTPCQYKNSYRYYLAKGDDYVADNQLESALESYKRALIIQPNSEEARLKISKIEYRLRQKEELKPLDLRQAAIEEAMEGAQTKKQIAASKKEIADYGEEAPRPAVPQEAYVKPTAKRITREPAPVRQPPKESLKDRRKRAIESELVQKYKPSSKGVPTTLDVGPYYYEGPMHLVRFNDALNGEIQEAATSMNDEISPNKVSGEYRLCFGVTTDDFIWKDANADYHNMPNDTSWRYIFGKDRYNTYDKKIYSRLKVDIENPINRFDVYNELVIDPWTFVGRKRVFVTGSGGDKVEMDLKYWSNASCTINQTYRSEKGDIVNVQENKVRHGKTSTESYSGLKDWGSNRFSVPQLEIDRMYVPLRKSWIDYNNEPYKARVFFMASQDEALTSNDPLRLSNNKVWWEESPWLDTYEPSKLFKRSGISAPVGYTKSREPLKKGQWVRNQSFMARDSDDQRLTFLRGASFDASFKNDAKVNMVAATPRNLWDTYNQASSLPLAIRGQTPFLEKFTLGGLYTLKTGFRHESAEAFNNVFAVDGIYNIKNDMDVLTEVAVSNLDVDEENGYKNGDTGYASMIGFKNKGPLTFSGGANDKYEFQTSLTHIDNRFFPGLSNYRLTRKDFEFAKHIYFDELRPENEACKVGDGIDVGRNVFNVTAKAKFPDNNIDTRFDLRNAHSDGGDFIENVVRAEGTYKTNPKLTFKGLAYYQYLPKTKKGIDPLINAKNSYSAFTDYFAYDDEWVENSSIPSGEDPSIGSFSAGLKYDFCDYFTGIGIYETTNDPKDWPRGLLNDVYVTDSYKDGIVWDKIVPFLYSQSAFGIPPYSYHGIYKTKFIYYPFAPIKVSLNYVYNENKYAMAIDDNSTHQGAEIEYTPNKRLKLGFLYQYTRQRDIYREFIANQGDSFEGHHNIFGALDYDLNKDQHLTLMFGEYVGYSYLYPEDHNALTALDTQHIVRLAYSGSWGETKKQKDELELDNALTPLGEFNPPIPGAGFVANLYSGWARYKEEAEVANVNSDWDAYFSKVEFGIDAYDKENIEGGLRLGLLGTLKGHEKWERQGSGQYQTNDMDLSGADVNADIGWAICDVSKYVSFTPLLNAGYRRLEFKRSKFKYLGSAVSQIGEVGQTANVSFMGIGGKVDFFPKDGFNFYASGFCAPFVYAPFHNEEIGNLTCDEGLIWHAETGCNYSFSSKWDINFGGFWDQQDLSRVKRVNNNVVNAELPENKLETFGLKLGGLYKF